MWEIPPLLPDKPLTRSSPKFAWVIRLRLGPLPLCKNSLRYSYPFCPLNVRKCASSDSGSFLGGRRVLQTAYNKAPCTDFTISMSNDVSCKMCLFRFPKTKFYILMPFSPKNVNLGLIFDMTLKISAQKRLNNGDAHQ